MSLSSVAIANTLAKSNDDSFLTIVYELMIEDSLELYSRPKAQRARHIVALSSLSENAD